MGQTNLIRTQFCPVELITSSEDNKRQTVDFTSYFKVGDLVDIVALKNGECCPLGVLATDLVVEAVEKHVALNFTTSVDTSTALPSGATGWYAVAKNIDDGQEAIDRLYRHYTNGKNPFNVCVSISGFELDTPSAGQATYDVPDTSFWRVGDTATIICDDGVAGEATVLSVNENADDTNNASTIVLDSNIDLTAKTGCHTCIKGITMSQAIKRNKEEIDFIDRPVENEFIDVGNCEDTVFETDNLFLQGTSKLLLDGRRLRLGTCGTLATLTNDSGNAQIILTSLILGLDGNKTEIVLTDPAAPSSALSITVTKNFSSGHTIDVSLETDGGSAIISTAQDVVDAINADADAKRIVLAQYGGDGTGVQSALTSTPLAGGLDDGTGDYCEIEQVYENNISGTGYKWLSLWIIPDNNNRLNKPPRSSEELVVDYRLPLSNA